MQQWSLLSSLFTIDLFNLQLTYCVWAKHFKRDILVLLDTLYIIIELSVSIFQFMWEFIKENKKVKKKENTLLTKKATKKTKRKNDNGLEKKKKSNGLSTKKERFKKNITI